MKRTFIICVAIAVAIFTLIPKTMANSMDKKEKSKQKEVSMVKQSETINVAASDLWQIVGPGFERAAEWSEAVDSSVGSGEAAFQGATCSNRVCHLNAAGFDRISETLTLYDEGQHELTYEVNEGMPKFVTLAENNWQVIDLGYGKSALKMNVTMRTKGLMGRLMGGMMKKNISKTMDSVFRDLKVYAETGDISAEKAKRMARLARK